VDWWDINNYGNTGSTCTSPDYGIFTSGSPPVAETPYYGYVLASVVAWPHALLSAWGTSDPADVLDAVLPRCNRGHRGARRPGQVDSQRPAATLELKDDDQADITAAIDATGAGTGAASPSALFASTRRQQGASWAQPEAQPRLS
jgi:hypothetical protein